MSASVSIYVAFIIYIFMLVCWLYIIEKVFGIQEKCYFSCRERKSEMDDDRALLIIHEEIGDTRKLNIGDIITALCHLVS